MDRRTIRPERTDVSEVCTHCSGSRYVLDVEETSFGEWDEHFHLCHMCFGTGRRMTKSERKVHRKATRAGRS